MKKVFSILLFASLFFITLPANAQMKFGVKGGLNVTTMSLNTDVFDATNRMGYFVGPTVKFSLPVIGLGLDLSALYDHQEVKISGAGSQNVTIRQNAVAIPVNLRYGIGLGDMANVFVFAGPQVAFNVGDKVQNIFDDAANWELKQSKFSVNLGGGVVALDHLQVSINYNIGLGKTGEMTFKKAVEGTRDNLKTKGTNSSWQLGVAYFF